MNEALKGKHTTSIAAWQMMKRDTTGGDWDMWQGSMQGLMGNILHNHDTPCSCSGNIYPQSDKQKQIQNLISSANLKTN